MNFLHVAVIRTIAGKILLAQNILCSTFISTFIGHLYHLRSCIELRVCEDNTQDWMNVVGNK
jgi:hypothetical protein